MKDNRITRGLTTVALLALAAPLAQASPEMIISDGTDSVTITSAGTTGVGATGMTTYLNSGGDISWNGSFADGWSVNVDTGIGSPPFPGMGTINSPYIDLNVDNFYQGVGTSELTVKYIVDGLGPSLGTINVGGTLGPSGTTSVLLNGSVVDSGSAGVPFSTPIDESSTYTLGLQEEFTTGSAVQFSGDEILTVPDAGATVAMLGTVVAALGGFRKLRKSR